MCRLLVKCNLVIFKKTNVPFVFAVSSCKLINFHCLCCSLIEDMKKLAEERRGGPMLFELIEVMLFTISI